MGESGCLRVQPKEGGILHLRLNKNERPIAHKYRKGKMQRTLKREFKELEVVEREAIAANCKRMTCSEINVPGLNCRMVAHDQVDPPTFTKTVKGRCCRTACKKGLQQNNEWGHAVSRAAAI